MEGFSPRRGSYGSAVNSEASVEDTGKADAVPFSEGPAAEAESSAAQAAAEIPGAGQFPPQYQTLPEDLLREIDDSGPDKEECTPFKEARWDRMSANPGLFASPEQGIGAAARQWTSSSRLHLHEVRGKPKKNKQTQVDEGFSVQLVEVSRSMRGSAVTSIESSAGAQCYAEVVKELKELKERMDGNERGRVHEPHAASPHQDVQYHPESPERVTPTCQSSVDSPPPVVRNKLIYLFDPTFKVLMHPAVESWSVKLPKKQMKCLKDMSAHDRKAMVKAIHKAWADGEARTNPKQFLKIVMEREFGDETCEPEYQAPKEEGYGDFY
ncbi:unnamed protein product [Cladocopium goreaui]|uniref:Uncharacterized protein n=1 Tax=Cladocopium goreaui TaxID=2562237 RepID=A0A9P1GFT9_9DINO|nr:unnamed protein product [Cladocopium goreaui]